MSRILVVSDEESLRILYTEELLEEGYEVTATFAGAEGLALIEEPRPDLVLLDIRSGQAGVIDLLGEIEDLCGDLPIIVCMSRIPFPYRLRSVAADHCVLKSSRLTDLKLRIRMVLEGSTPSPRASARGQGPEPGYRIQTGFC